MIRPLAHSIVVCSAAVLTGAALAQPSNDTCANAIALEPGVTTTFSFAGSTITVEKCSFFDNGEVWFRFTNTLPCDVEATFSTSGSVADTSLAAYDACGGTQLKCELEISDSNLNARFTLPVLAGETVWLSVGVTGPADPAQILVTTTNPDVGDDDNDGMPNCVDTCPDDPNVVNARTGQRFATLSAAVAAASPGDTLELGPCVLNETGITLANRDLTIRGAGMGLSVIDAQGQGDLFEFVVDDSVFEDLSMRNGVPTANDRGGALTSDTSSQITLRRVELSGHSTDSAEASIAFLNGGSLTLERCIVTGNVARPSGGSHFRNFTSSITAISSLFADNPRGEEVFFARNGGATVLVTGSTFANNAGSASVLAANGAVGEVNNSVSDINLRGGSTSGQFNAYPNASGANNVAGMPIFADAAGGDYRLAAGSPGIDAADAVEYLSSDGGFFDLGGGARTNNDAGVPDTGSGPFTFLDAGAFEFQGNTPNAMDADFNKDGSVDVFDILDLLAAIDAFIAP